MLSYTPTPIQEIKDTLFDDQALRVFVKREELNHPYVSGNKWWKLKYNLEKAKKLGYKKLLTFGGAYSNHIYATAAAAHELGFESIGIIRGEETLPLNPTLSFAKSCSMHLHYVSREDYRKKADPAFIKTLENLFGEFYLIPEGGTNELAVQGVSELAHLLEAEFDFDYCCVPVGTGGTMAGMISGFSASKHLMGFSALKGGDFLIDEIKKYLPKENESNWQLIADYHFGGYAKTTNELLQFMHDFKERHHISLDFIYTAKMMCGLYDLIRKEKFKKGSVILCVHTGGLQGNLSLNV
jgi:1-aminocyclopropane-1-carboxylate deaminase